MIHLIQNPSDWKDLKEYVRESGYKSILPLSPVCKQEDLSAQDFLAFAFKEDEKFSIEMSKFGPWYKEDIKTWLTNLLPPQVEGFSEGTHNLFTWELFLKFKDLVSTSKPEDYLVIDTETDGVVEKTAKIYGVGLCFDDKTAFYIPIRNKFQETWWTSEQEEEIKTLVYQLCSTHKVIGHNIIYDCLVLESNWGFDISKYIYSDTILQKHAVDEERPFGLKDVAVKYLGAWANKAQEALYKNIEDNGGKTTKDCMEMFKADTEVLAEYCCWDVLLTKKLFDIFEKKLQEENLMDLFYKEEIMPLYKEVTIQMKRVGFPVDVEYFHELNSKIKEDITKLEKQMQDSISDKVIKFCDRLLDDNYPVKATGSFPKYYADLISFALPVKNEKITLAKAEINKILEPQLETHRNFLSWLKGTEELNPTLAYEAQRYWYFKDNPDTQYIFNLKSNNHLKWLFFDCLGETPLSKTETGAPQVDDDFLESIKSTYPWVNTLVDLKKLQKLKSTYIEGVLERHIDGVIYSTFKQFGPPSGRYASSDPNLQNLPRVKEDDSGLSPLVLEYVNSIKKGFIAPKGKKIVNADYSQLEPRAFSEACGDKLLQGIFINKEDLYGSIAKNIWSLDCTANEVKKKYPEYRQKAKIVALAVVYGAEAGRISGLMGIPYEEAQEVIDDYLNAYPGLKDYMERCDKEVCSKGFIKTKFGRTRHLPLAKIIYQKYGFKLLNKKWAKSNGCDETRWKFKNMLNLAKNFPIQGVAAHIVNRAAIAINLEFKKQGIEGQLVAQVHDELTCIVREDQAEQARLIVKDKMENTTLISVPLIAEPLIGVNWAESK